MNDHEKSPENGADSSSPSPPESAAEATPPSRRGFFGAVLAASAAAGAAAVSGCRPERDGPRELELHEADFYRPHDLLG